MYERIELQIIAVASLLIVGIGIHFRRNEKPMFSIDIPDFPPAQLIRIPVKKMTVIELFNKTNQEYSWECMPLSIDEIKRGFMKIMYNGRPILIGEFSLERLLEKLQIQGIVFNELGYYGLTQWSEQKQKQPWVLSAYRKMRDVFVNNAINFSRIGFSNQKCDCKAKMPIEYAIHVYDSNNVLIKAIGTIKENPTIIIFKNEDEKNKFEEYLYSTNQLLVILKMAIERKRMFIIPIDELEEFVKERKK